MTKNNKCLQNLTPIEMFNSFCSTPQGIYSYIGESIYGKIMVNLKQIGTKDFSTVFINIVFAEQHSINIVKSNVKHNFFIFKV